MMVDSQPTGEAPSASIGSRMPEKCGGYSAPGQDNTRALYHAWFEAAARVPGAADAGGDGLKRAVHEFESSWYIAAALMMTIGYSLFTVELRGRRPGSWGDAVATYAYVTLALFGTMNSVLGVWWAGHSVPQVHWHPAGEFGKYWSFFSRPARDGATARARSPRAEV